MYELVVILLAAAVSVPLFYAHNRFIKAVIAFEKAQYDDSDCPPGFTNYPGPM